MKAAVLLVLGIGISLGAPPPAQREIRPLIDNAQIERWTQTWQKRLDLNDWRIITQIVRTWDLKPDTLGNLRWNSADHSAVIKVLDPLDYDLPAGDVPQDIEYTIVHELIHLQLSVLPRDPGAKRVEERVVNKIAEALFQLEKGAAYHSHSYSAHDGPKAKPAGSEASRSIP